MSTNEILFFGHNWQDMGRLEALAQFEFLQDGDYSTDGPDGTRVPNHYARVGYLAARFRGPALDWAAKVIASQPGLLNNYPAFVTGVKQHFGIDDETIQIQNREELDKLVWGRDVSVFFAELDRICFSLSVSTNEAKINLVLSKLPARVKQLLAEQALTFNNYDTMRSRLTTMWMLGAFGQGGALSHLKCSKCGKKNHTAANCRSEAKN